MALAQHTDDRLRYEQQVLNAGKYVIPFIEQKFQLAPGMHVMEIGCGEGGVLLPFLERDCRCVGVDLVASRIELAKNFLKEYLINGSLQLVNKNIYDVDFYGVYQHTFDLIILKDAIEHIPDQEKIINFLKTLLKPGGMIYFGFPPWYMPHGGHQQICKNKFLSMLPYIHLLPTIAYKGLLRLFGESEAVVNELMEVKSTGISIERFEKIIRRLDYKIVNKIFYLINPIYEYKFKLTPRKQNSVISSIPYMRDFLTTCVYYLITPA
jgi:SAM-dependent methyltransferase